MRNHLELGYLLGDNICAYLMGHNYYYGNYGFEQDDELAWKWFSAAANLRNPESYNMLAMMIGGERAPKGYNDDYAVHCLLQAVRYGDNSYMNVLITAYQEGMLNHHCEEIEEYYLPLADRQDVDDDGRYDAWV